MTMSLAVSLFIDYRLQKWVAHCQKLHKERLAKMKARIDQEAPACASIKLDGAKRKQLQADRQAEVDLVSLRP